MMEPIDHKILRELLPVEKEVPVPSRSKRGRRDEPPEADHWTHAVLLERAAYLRKLARYSEGSASETLKEYPQHCTMLSFRGRSGIAELHENFADIFIVLEGRATLVTGGSVVGGHSVGPGETRGDSLEGGSRMELRPGDIAHVPAGVPHQMLVPGDKAFTAFVVKVRENPEPKR
jgi:mannose-6-phosphate isomerase-like protein (cupin superfamily)